MAAASMHSHKALTQPTVIGDCVGWRSAQRELVQTSLASAVQTRARKSRFVCQLGSPTHDLAASDNSSEVGAQPNPAVGALSLEEMALIRKFERSSFRADVSQVNGESPHQFVLRQRVE